MKKYDVKYHPLTTPMKLFMYTTQLVSTPFWPLFGLVDLSRYEKSKLGIREDTPPYPFQHFEWIKEP